MPKTFLITGTSTGFGAALVTEVLSHGDNVIATARKSSALPTPSSSSSDNYLAYDLDVTSKSSVRAAFDAGIAKFGNIDVVVNNAGYGLSGEFESLGEEQMRRQMEVNFWGLLDVTKVALDTMRPGGKGGKGGVIQQVTSIGGQLGVPTYSIYCASKWAVEGFTEAVQKELKPEWNISLTLIEPGGFRTDWAGRSMDFPSEESKNPAYTHIDARANAAKRNGTQAGDPVKAAKVFYDLAVMKDPPMRCVVGTDAFKGLGAKLEEYGKNRERFAEWSNSTDVEGYEAPS
ncbi:NAD(P)-binding protein [Aulographum hederae CBS 113979]|uniref:NAD(P)-binding protein n=1 Tax=Aulographum hederae CBS 113979 TaxID=1176131 RepID=A0A6G1HGS6_9PEZI|nr:NAD(P)-binding protein [Aulographum hederae CBS 113979]